MAGTSLQRSGLKRNDTPMPYAPLIDVRNSHWPSLPPLKDGWALFAESDSGLMGVSGAKAAQNGFDLVLKRALQFWLQRQAQQLFALADGQRGAAEQLIGQRLNLGVQLFWLGQAMQQTQPLSNGRRKDISHQDNLAGHPLSNQARQQNGRAARDNHPYASLHAAQARPRAGDAKIAGQSQLKAAAKGVSIHRCDGWFFAKKEQARQALQVHNQRQKLFGRLMLGLFEIISDAEVATCAGENDHRDIGVALGAFKRLAQGRNHPSAHRVHSAGAIHHNASNLISNGIENGWRFAAHATSWEQSYRR